MRNLRLVIAQPLGAADCFGHIRDTSTAPAADLVAEWAVAAEPSRSDRPLEDNPTLGGIVVPRWSHLNHEAGAPVTHLKRGVIQVFNGAEWAPENDEDGRRSTGSQTEREAAETAG